MTYLGNPLKFGNIFVRFMLRGSYERIEKAYNTAFPECTLEYGDMTFHFGGTTDRFGRVTDTYLDHWTEGELSYRGSRAHDAVYAHHRKLAEDRLTKICSKLSPDQVAAGGQIIEAYYAATTFHERLPSLRTTSDNVFCTIGVVATGEIDIFSRLVNAKAMDLFLPEALGVVVPEGHDKVPEIRWFSWGSNIRLESRYVENRLEPGDLRRFFKIIEKVEHLDVQSRASRRRIASSRADEVLKATARAWLDQEVDFAKTRLSKLECTGTYWSAMNELDRLEKANAKRRESKGAG